jgi:HD-GYP domain-containing protein (c-di-GMP phosphodiesterase class II)
MIFPALKKEIHVLLIKRISAVCLFAALIVAGTSLYLEFRQLESTLLSYAEKEAKLFVPLFLDQLKSSNQLSSEDLAPQLAVAIGHTSFIAVELYNENREVFFERRRANSETIKQQFLKKGIITVLDDRANGSWIIADKRIYLDAAIPMIALQDDKTIGYVKGMYRSSLQDTKVIIHRFLLSALIGAGAVLLCGLLMYPGLLFFQNHLIKSSSELNRANGFLLKHLGAAIAKCDSGHQFHNHRVLIYGIRLAENQKLQRSQIRSFIQGAFLHDIGMLDLDTSLLMKPEPFDDTEQKLMQEHVKRGAALIKPYRWLRSGVEVVRYHHEKYDGSGYPAGISHDKIPGIARIFTIVDAFDALTSNRPYREAQELDQALRVLEQDSGSHFDPVLLSAFIEIAPKLYSVVSKLDGKPLERELNGVLKKYIKT